MIGDPVASKRLMVSPTAAFCSSSSCALVIFLASYAAYACCSLSGRGMEPTGSVGIPVAVRGLKSIANLPSCWFMALSDD